MIQYSQGTTSPLDETRTRAQRALESLAGADGRPPHVLVLEDDSFAGKRVSWLLTRAGCRTVLAESVDDGVRLLDRGGREMDLVVLGLPADHESRGALLEKATERWDGVRVLLLSDPASDDDGEPGRPFLRKPFGPTQLLETVARVLRSTPGGV